MKKRVAEIMYIVPEEREEFINGALNPTEEEQKMLWLCGVRKQQYFEMNDLIFMTFEYKGHDFAGDMQRMSAYLESVGHLVQKRRKDVPVEERATTNWWAPIKKLGGILEASPEWAQDSEDTWQENYMRKLDGEMRLSDAPSDISYDEDDWTESIHI